MLTILTKTYLYRKHTWL